MPDTDNENISDEDIYQSLKNRYKKNILNFNLIPDLSLDIKAEIINDLVKHLKDSRDFQFTTFIDICGVDYPNRNKRFDVVYHFLSMKKNKRIRIKAAIDEKESIESIVNVFPAADWYEREAYDLYGINFNNHPDLRRMLTDYNFQGFPLRKDFPLTGFNEVRYSEKEKKVIYEAVKLEQNYRNFDFESPWEGTKYIKEIKENNNDKEK